MESLREDDPGRVGEVVTRTRAVPDVSLAGFLDAADGPRTVWSAPDEPTVAGSGAAATLTADGERRFEGIRARAEELFAAVEARPSRPSPARPRLLGGFAFHDDHRPVDPWNGFRGARFVLPSVQVTWGDRTWLTVAAVDPDGDPDERLDRVAERLRSASNPDPDPAPPPGVSDRRYTPSRAEWRGGVREAVDRIDGGELRKVVLSQSLSVELDGPVAAGDVLGRLGGAYPDCYRFLVEPDDGAGSFVGATPERLVSLDGRRVRTEALAGSTGRGDTPQEDDWLATELLGSEKDRHEHDLVVDAVREQLAGLASSVGVGPRTVRRLATVQHLHTPIHAELGDSEHVLGLVEALHPTPAVGGLPPDRALATIREAEAFERGWYAAPVGWFDAAGNGSFAVAIRSAVLDDYRATLFAGAGIVGDSDPDREYDEVQLKYGPILDALQ